MMKRYWLLLLLAALLLCPLSASAANMFYVSVSEAQPENGLPRDAVAMSKVGSKYYLFLPGAADAKCVRRIQPFRNGWIVFQYKQK